MISLDSADSAADEEEHSLSPIAEEETECSNRGMGDEVNYDLHSINCQDKQKHDHVSLTLYPLFTKRCLCVVCSFL